MDAGAMVSLGAWLVLAAAVGALAVAAQRRHARVRKRLRRVEREVHDAEARADRILRHVYAREIEAGLAAAGKRARFPIELTSQFGEDAFLWDLFGGKLDGFFVEVGAYDGYALSPTYALEAAGWTGLLVEAMPERHAQCAARRTGSRVVCAAVSRRGSAGTATFTIATGGDEPYSDMVSGLEPGDAQMRIAAREGARLCTIQTPLTTLADLLRGHGGPIDVAVIDVEGAEADVLDGLELERTRPRVVLVEDLSGGGDVRTAALMEKAGYREAAWLGHNRLYVRGDEPALFERARRLAGVMGNRAAEQPAAAGERLSKSAD